MELDHNQLKELAKLWGVTPLEAKNLAEFIGNNHVRQALEDLEKKGDKT